MSPNDKPLVWLHAEIKSPPLSQTARVEVGFLLRQLQRGERMGLPHIRPMPSVGERCDELRVQDQDQSWRVMLRLDPDAIIIAEAFSKKTQRTPPHVIAVVKQRLNSDDT